MLKRLVTGVILAACTAVASAFPSQPVSFVVPYSPGGLTDQLARLYAEKLAQKWGKPVVVENRPGAGSSIGAGYVARAKADGHTILLGSVGMVTNAKLLPSMPYRTDELTPLARLALAPNVLYVHPSVPATNVKELVDYAKKNPGALSFASSGVGSSPHLAAELFAAKTRIDVIQVPYKGTGAAIADFIGGQVNAYFDTMQSMKYAQEGKIRALAVTTEERLAEAPELPTVQESGVADGVISGSWFGIFIPTNVPADTQKELLDAFAAIGQDPAVQQEVARLGLLPAFQDQNGFKSFVDAEAKKWGDVIDSQNIKLN
jgi:Uncharacterized protein conserved in bacteria